MSYLEPLKDNTGITLNQLLNCCLRLFKFNNLSSLLHFLINMSKNSFIFEYFVVNISTDLLEIDFNVLTKSLINSSGLSLHKNIGFVLNPSTFDKILTLTGT